MSFLPLDCMSRGWLSKFGAAGGVLAVTLIVPSAGIILARPRRCPYLTVTGIMTSMNKSEILAEDTS